MSNPGNVETDETETKSAPTIEDALSTVTNGVEIEFGNDQYGDAIAILGQDGRRRALPVYSRKFRRWIDHALYRAFKKPSSKGHVDSMLDVCAARGLYDGRKYHLDPRVTYAEGVIYYDLGGRVVRIDASSWTLIDEAPILFREYESMKPQVTPLKGGDLNWLLDLFQISGETDRLLITAWIISAFVPWIAHPILIVHGQQGSAKSTLARLLLELIDPNLLTEFHFSDYNQFLQAADHRWVVPIDNISLISATLSDILCKLVTGAGILKRALYSNDDDFFRAIRRVVIINGLTATAEKADLLDRCILISLERIPDDKRKSEQSVMQMFEEKKPYLLGACFDILSQAMRLKDDINFTALPRMADFALLGGAIAKSLGYEAESFLTAYNTNVSRQHQEAQDASSVATVLTFYLRSHKQISGTPTDILKIVLDTAVDAGVDRRILPKTPRSLGRALVEITPTLSGLGYVVNRSRGESRLIEILPPSGRHLDAAREALEKRNNLASSTSFPSSNAGEKNSDDISTQGGVL